VRRTVLAGELLGKVERMRTQHALCAEWVEGVSIDPAGLDPEQSLALVLDHVADSRLASVPD
jgi:hypothetical protein